ncbi:hypothetical protein ACVBGC_30035 [Burkholderia stagnalis]
MNTTRHRYGITDLRRMPIATLTIEHATDKMDGIPDAYCSGSVFVGLEYPDPSPRSTASITRSPFHGKWSCSNGSVFTMHIGDFILPPELCFRGIGTLCWSLIHRTLPSPPGNALVLAGALSRKDATITVCSRGNVRQVPNLVRRNAFWRRMLDPAGLIFESDANGEGFFRGRFVDPAAHASYTAKAIATPL